MLITYVLVTAYLLTCIDTDGKCGVDGALGVGVSVRKLYIPYYDLTQAAVFLGTVIAYRPTKGSMNPARSFATLCAYSIFRCGNVISINSIRVHTGPRRRRGTTITSTGSDHSLAHYSPPSSIGERSALTEGTKQMHIAACF